MSQKKQDEKKHKIIKNVEKTKIPTVNSLFKQIVIYT